MFINISLLIVSIAILVFGAERFVDASSKIARNFGISDLFVGLTIVALGWAASSFGPHLFKMVGS